MKTATRQVCLTCKPGAFGLRARTHGPNRTPSSLLRSFSLGMLLVAWAGVAAEIAIQPGEPTPLEQGFRQPPDAAKPRVYWWWLNSLVNRAGITRDLEEFKAKGIGGVLLFDAGGPAGPMPPGPTFMGPEWRELFKHTLREANRLGLEVSVNLCSGWDAGGPWIGPEHASKHFVQSELTLEGPQRFSGQLPPPPGDTTNYHEVAVQAFREAAGREHNRPVVTASSSQAPYPAARAADGDEQTFWVSNGWKPGDAPSKDRPEWLRLEFPKPVKARTLRLIPHRPHGPRAFELQTSADGQAFTTVKSFTLENKDPGELAFPETTARIFRLVFTGSYAAENVQVSEVALGDMRIGRNRALALKSGRGSLDPLARTMRECVAAPLAEPDAASSDIPVNPAELVELTGRTRPNGHLEWDVPAGEWTILRTGYTITGKQVGASSPGGAGPEVDWLNAAAMEHHFKSMADVLVADAGPLAGKTLKYFHDDSWEVELPNWTAGFLDEFKKYRGYDATPYLPVLAGRLVTSAAVSDRFLYDFRKTIADCLAENHYRRFRDLAQARGVAVHAESGGPCYPTIVPMDALKNLGRCDIPMGEFWQSEHWKENNQNKAGKQTATAAHIYGRALAAAEAFTHLGPRLHWGDGPSDLKPTADIAFCEGINRFVLHTATCTRPEDGLPGFEYAAGTHSNPNVTWWQKSGPWLEYIARCQFLLSRGLFVADVCYYYGDHAPSFVEPKHTDPALGPGYDYDVCNAEVILTRMTVRDGRVQLPDGMSYRLLVLPDRAEMPVEVLQRIEQLVAAGATVVGPRPQKSAGLRDYPACDAAVQELAAELWGDCDGKTVSEHRFGHGRVLWGRPLREILLAADVQPDFAYTAGSKDAFLDFIHRRDGEAELYFVCNRKDRAEAASCVFRVSGKQPELWDPLTGQTRAAAAFEQSGGRTTLRLEFAPYGSLFVVFRKPIGLKSSDDLARSGANQKTARESQRPRAPHSRAKEPGQGAPAASAGSAAGPPAPHPANGNFPVYSRVDDLDGPWEVKFDPRWGGPATVVFEQLVSWPKRPEDGIKFYSGTATYRQTFDLPDPLRQPGIRLALDLGEVQNLAEVRLNGQRLGVVWTTPFRVEITQAVKLAGNRLEVEVVNLWPNRLIGDAGLPPEKRFTRSNVQFRKDAPLLESGLLGPVTLQLIQVEALVVGAPRNYQVFQRRTRSSGLIRVRGQAPRACDTVQVRLLPGGNQPTAAAYARPAQSLGRGVAGGRARSAAALDGPPTERLSQWRHIPIDPDTRKFHTEISTPTGWYRLELRALNGGRLIALEIIEHVGVGEMFVVAGQSNATNYGSERQKTVTGMVASFDGANWVLANDPQPGVQDGSGGGSFLPAFGDAMYARYRVPIGVASVGCGATSVRQWLMPGEPITVLPTLTAFVKTVGPRQWEAEGTLFGGLMRRISALGPHGFRALLWHQGESDAGQARAGYPADRQITGAQYRQLLEKIIRASQDQAGWKFPWFVAQATYHTAADPADAEFRQAQKSLWESGLAREGPDTDALAGDYRDGVHFNAKGLAAHGRLWAEKVANYLDPLLAAE